MQRTDSRQAREISGKKERKRGEDISPPSEVKGLLRPSAMARIAPARSGRRRSSAPRLVAAAAVGALALGALAAPALAAKAPPLRSCQQLLQSLQLQAELLLRS